MASENNLKRVQVKCHGKFKTSISVSGSKNKVNIGFIADKDTVDLNKLADILKDGATAIFVSDQTSLPTDDEKTKKADGQLTLLDNDKEGAK